MGLREDMIAAYGFRVQGFEFAGQTYYLRRLMGDEGSQFLRGDMPADEIAFAVLFFSLCDENGERLFADADDVRKSLGLEFIIHASQEAMRFNGLGAEDEGEAGKSKETPDGGSPSG